MDDIGKYNKLLTVIYTDLMLNEIDRMKDGFMKDLTFHETHTIEIIGDMKEAKMSRIAKKANVTQSTMTTMIDKLVEKGMVERERSENDRRVVNVKLTEKGEAAYREHENIHRQVTSNWLGILNEEEKRFLLTIMEKIASFVEVGEG